MVGSSVAEPVLFGRSRSWYKGPASGSGSTIDKKDEIFNDILFVSSHIDKRSFTKQIHLYINEISLVRKKGHCFKKMVMVE